MPSGALHNWQTFSRCALDEIEAAHASVGGRGRGRRYATQQINQAYVVILASQFQRFCRDLHTEAVAHVINHAAVLPVRAIMQARMVEARRLDMGNPNPGNIGSDFRRLGLDLWGQLGQLDPRSAVRQGKLEDLNRWRNAIAHYDFSKPALGGQTEVQLLQVRAWRRSCDALAVAFDRVVGIYLTNLVGVAPW
ncbi:MAG TPA: hypothetical protein VHG91_12595 [Longimicrobium sp.]|nr:hypothetical protein [Longimicrobium sp.]